MENWKNWDFFWVRMWKTWLVCCLENWGFCTSRLVYRRVSISTQKETARRLERKLHKVETSLISSKRLQVSRNTTAVQGYGMLWRCSCLIVSTRLLGCSAQLPPFSVQLIEVQGISWNFWDYPLVI